MEQNNCNCKNKKLEIISLFLRDLKKIAEIDNFTSELKILKTNEYRLFVNFVDGENEIEKEKIENLLTDYFYPSLSSGLFYNEFSKQYSIIIKL